jgi:fatty acid desaturase
MGLLFQRVSLLTHESWHRHLFTNTKVNDWFGKWLLSYTIITRWDSQREKHFEHHRLALTDSDPDKFYWGWSPSEKAELIKTVLGHLTGILTLKHILNVIQKKTILSQITKKNQTISLPELESKKSDNREPLWGIFLVQSIIATIFIIVFSHWVGFLYYSIFWLAPLLTVNSAASYWRQFVEHNQGKMLIFNCNFIEKFFFGDFGFSEHAVHHLSPSLYWYQLKEYRLNTSAYNEKCHKKGFKIEVANGYFNEFRIFLDKATP